MRVRPIEAPIRVTRLRPASPGERVDERTPSPGSAGYSPDDERTPSPGSAGYSPDDERGRVGRSLRSAVPA
jgi:hypothetical protein